MAKLEVVGPENWFAYEKDFYLQRSGVTTKKRKVRWREGGLGSPTAEWCHAAKCLWLGSYIGWGTAGKVKANVQSGESWMHICPTMAGNRASNWSPNQPLRDPGFEWSSTGFGVGSLKFRDHLGNVMAKACVPDANRSRGMVSQKDCFEAEVRLAPHLEPPR